MRLSRVTDELVTREARRTRRSKGALVESLAEEALRTRRLPGIAFRGTDWNRRPWVIGTALGLALAYYETFPQEIDDAIAENSRPLEQLRREYPAIDTLNA
jgi:hypothetical protein